jgi:hypothetical protein
MEAINTCNVPRALMDSTRIFWTTVQVTMDSLLARTKLKRKPFRFSREIMYEGFIVILTAAGVQLTSSWNYHRTYASLYKEFHSAIENISKNDYQLSEMN